MAGKRRLLDTNLIVRHLVQDHEQHSRVAGRLFEASDRGRVTLVVLPVVLAECVFVLESVYGKDREEIADALTVLTGSPGIEMREGDTCLDALARYKRSKLHFIDCMLAATVAVEKIAIASFDAGFRKFAYVTVDVNLP